MCPLRSGRPWWGWGQPQAAWRAAARERNLLSEEQWSSIKAPTLVVASGQDHGDYQSTARRVATLIPNSEVLEMPAVRHWPAFEAPAAFNAAALRFLLS